MNKKKLLEKILSGSKNIRFDELVSLAEAFGFELARIRGSHHIFEHPNVPERLNLQIAKGKPNHTRSASSCNLLSNTT